MQIRHQNDRLNEMPDLLTYLEDSYLAEKRQPKDLKIDHEDFMRWSRDHLTQVRPSELFPVADNYGILLTNGQSVQFCTATNDGVVNSGDMANPDDSIQLIARR